MQSNLLHATTILCVKRDNCLVIASDGQVSLGNTIVKSNTKKIRRLGKNNDVVTGFAGSVSDAMTLLDLLEKKLEEFKDLKRACYELMRLWRSDKYIRNLEATIIVANLERIFMISGDGTMIEPDTNIAATGSGGLYALSSANALYENTNLSAEEIVRKSMKIAADLCVYTNHNITLDKLEDKNQNA
jgi:ATP-dependent HslUV protease subunit HslV